MHHGIGTMFCTYPLIVASVGDHWRPVQTFSFGDSLPTQRHLVVTTETGSTYEFQEGCTHPTGMLSRITILRASDTFICVVALLFTYHESSVSRNSQRTEPVILISCIFSKCTDVYQRSRISVKRSFLFTIKF